MSSRLPWWELLGNRMKKGLRRGREQKKELWGDLGWRSRRGKWRGRRGQIVDRGLALKSVQEKIVYDRE